MNYKNSIIAVTLFSLAACSSPEKNAQAIHDYDYLNTTPLSSNQGGSAYAIPQVSSQGGIGKSIDIRPPQVGLQVVPGSEVFLSDHDAYLWLESANELALSWNTLKSSLAKHNITSNIISPNVLETGWTTFNIKTDRVRYRFEQSKNGSRYGIRSSVIGFEQNGKSVTPTAIISQRYNTAAINLIGVTTEKAIRDVARKNDANNHNAYSFSMSSDNNGIPIIVVDLPYGPFWEQASQLFVDLGFKVEDFNRSLGEMNLKYGGTKDNFGLDSGTYTLQIGDLKDKSSLNMTNSKGRLITPEQLIKLTESLNKVVSSQKK